VLAAAPPVDGVVPPVEEAVPPVEEVVPPVEDTVPPVEATAPPVEDTAPPVEEVVPPVEAAPPVPAVLGLVKVQYGATHLAPWLAHLQSESTVHQPSAPAGWLPAGLHAKTFMPIGTGALLVQLQTASPQAVPGQSMSL
jgi:hypothetical protein